MASIKEELESAITLHPGLTVLKRALSCIIQLEADLAEALDDSITLLTEEGDEIAVLDSDTSSTIIQLATEQFILDLLRKSINRD